MVGDPILPYNEFLDPNDELSNQEKLSAILNNENCFDSDLQLKNKDSLEINIKCPRENGHTVNLIYVFVFLDGVWKPTIYDPFDLERKKEKYGILQNLDKVEH